MRDYHCIFSYKQTNIRRVISCSSPSSCYGLRHCCIRDILQIQEEYSSSSFDRSIRFNNCRKPKWYYLSVSGGMAFNIPMQFHLPLIETPLLILSVAILGSILGMSFKITKFPHFIHIFVSVFASLFYILAFGSNSGIIYLIEVFLIVFISVIIPCCLSDIILPLLFTGKREH